MKEHLILDSIDHYARTGEIRDTLIPYFIILQPAILVGLMSIMTGHVLQDDLLATARIFERRGLDILRRTSESYDPRPT